MTGNGDRAYVITGVTGFLGSHLMAHLLERGSRVLALGRPADGKCLDERVGCLLEWFRIKGLSSRVEAYEVDFLRPGLGLTSSDYHKICRDKPVIVHCASDTRFSERFRQVSMETNVSSLSGIVRLAQDSRSPFVHYISTAYVAGRSREVSYEVPVDGGQFFNVYEQTKSMAEKNIALMCSQEKVPYCIVRPSVVYGDSTTGRSNRFNALYYHVRSLKMIRDIYMADIRERRGVKAGRLGIHLAPDGTLHMPLRIFLNGEGHVNLIPIDHFTSVMGKILENAQSGYIYHITDDEPKTTVELAAYCEKFLNVRGIEIVYGDQEGLLLTPPEEVFNNLARPYLPYLSDMRRFDRSNTREVAGGLRTPELTYEVFARCMNYALSVSWGRTGFS